MTPDVGIVDSPYLTLEEAARYARFDTCKNPSIAFRKWANRKALPFTRRGRVLLVEKRVLDAVLNPPQREQRRRTGQRLGLVVNR